MDSLKPDWENLPGWVSVVAVLLLLTKDYIKTGLTYLFSSTADRREHRQLMEESRTDFQFQDRATERLEERKERDRLLDMLNDNIHWSRTEFSDLQGKIEESVNFQKSQLFATNRTNDLITLHNAALAELVDEVKALTKEVGSRE